MRIPTDPYGLEGLACDLARQLRPVNLLYLAELLQHHAHRRSSVLSAEQQWRDQPLEAGRSKLSCSAAVESAAPWRRDATERRRRELDKPERREPWRC